MSTVSVTINGMSIEVEQGSTILQAAQALDVYIPTLCHMSLDCFAFENMPASCRICVVEVEGRPNMATACSTPVVDGMVVKTNSIRAINNRRVILDLLLSDHPKDCLICSKNTNCELLKLAQDMNLHRVRFEGEISSEEIDLSNESIARDMSKCIMCRRCEAACNKLQTVGVLSAVNRGFDAIVAPSCKVPLSESKCTYCGQCVAACPVGALTEIDHKYSVWQALNDSSKTVVVQTAPAVRVAIGEEMGMEPGAIATKKMVGALRAMGFDRVFDTNFAADLTIMEETTELIDRVTKGENLPILTSCCPGWVNFLEQQYPDLCHIPSTAKSPQQMFGAIAKSYYAQAIGVKPEDMVVVSVMPCLAKKYEAAREEFARDGVRDVDIVITTRELGLMFKEAGINFDHCREAEYDNPLGESTGAATIFGATGGVLEAALRTAADWISGENLDDIDFTQVRGLEGVKEATVSIAGMDVRVAVSSGLGNARKILDKVQAGEEQFHAIEIMACPGGCINGGGQPYIHDDTAILQKRMEALYRDDKNAPMRKSHENPHIIALYEKFLEKPGSHKAHELLHTSYQPRTDFF